MPKLYPGVTAPKFTPSQFTDYADADKYEARKVVSGENNEYRAAGKAKFAEKLCNFILDGCPESQFSGRFYTRLSNCFDHIAHYNAGGFYGTWFSTPDKQVDFLSNILGVSCYGQPEYTYSDVEQAVKAWVKESGIYQALEAVYIADHRQKQMEDATSILRKMPNVDRAKVLAGFAE